MAIVAGLRSSFLLSSPAAFSRACAERSPHSRRTEKRGIIRSARKEMNGFTHLAGRDPVIRCKRRNPLHLCRTVLPSTENERKGMNRRDFVISTFAFAVGLSTASRVFGQKKATEPDLAGIAEAKGFQVFNRSVSSLIDGTKKGVRLNEIPGDGVAYLPGIEFTDGTIE